MYYLHLFTPHQPDLNWDNPELRKKVYEDMKFWLDKGVDGWRLDVLNMYSKGNINEYLRWLLYLSDDESQLMGYPMLKSLNQVDWISRVHTCT
jgi:glycosidase